MTETAARLPRSQRSVPVTRSLTARLRLAARFARLMERHPELLLEGKPFADAGNDYAAAAKAKFDDLQKATATKVGDSIADLQNGKLTGEAAFSQIQKDLTKAHGKAYSLGKGRMLGKSVAMNADDAFYLRRALEVESEYLKGFINDIASGKTKLKGKMGAGVRGDLYSRGLRGSHNNARVEYSGGDDGDGYVTLCFWNLGISDSCVDCISLNAFNPWERSNLPTVPGAGDSACKSRCHCHLEFKRVRRGKSKGGKLLPLRPKAVRDVFKLPTPPSGLTLPTATERMAIEDLRQEVNYWRRTAAEELSAGNEEAYRSALSKRRAANADLNSWLKENKVWSPPAFGVDEVIAGKVLDERLVEALMSLGLDGATIAALPKAAYKEVVGEILAEAKLLDAEIRQTITRGMR